MRHPVHLKFAEFIKYIYIFVGEFRRHSSAASYPPRPRPDPPPGYQSPLIPPYSEDPPQYPDDPPPPYPGPPLPTKDYDSA